MLLNFYLFFIVLTSTALLISWIKHSHNFIKRSIILLVLLHVVCLALWGGIYTFSLLISMILLSGVYELAKQYSPSPFLGILYTAVFLGVLFLFIPYFIYLIPLFLLVSIYSFRGSSRQIFHYSFFILFSFFILGISAVSLIELYRLNSNHLILLLLLIQLNDAFALVGGSLYGKWHIFPKISPKKTLEGYLSGGVMMIVGIVILHTFIPVIKGNDLWQDGILFLYLFFFANAGDLLFSSIKRKLDIKDFSSFLPGHGGILDRFGNIFFAAPGWYILIDRGIIW